MDIVFYFHFYRHRPDFKLLHTLAFYVANINATWDKLYKTMDLCAQKMDAQYGEHSELRAYAHTDLIGYSSSEISAEHHNHVMHAWRTIFSKHFTGCVVSDVFDVTHIKGIPHIIYACTKDLFEHQQAQQLRDTLAAHITTPASTPAVKKI